MTIDGRDPQIQFKAPGNYYFPFFLLYMSKNMLRNSNHLKRVLISKYTTPTGCGGIFSVCQKSLYSTAPGKLCISQKKSLI